MSEGKDDRIAQCPVCSYDFPLSDIEQHVNTCLYLKGENNVENSKKRPTAPVLGASAQRAKLTIAQKSPRDKPTRTNSFKNDQIVQSTTIIKVKSNAPLAVRMRPTTTNDFFGQRHIMGEGSALKVLLDKEEIPNMILWGPPGCGKTSLAQVVHEICKKQPIKWKFVTLCAATCGIKDVQTHLGVAKNDLKFGKRTVMFMDEIHRFNKKQQDVFLMSVERGEITLIGATTENPSFILNNALLSRCRVVVLEKLTSEDIYKILKRAVESLDRVIVDDQSTNYNEGVVGIEKTALKWLADACDGDARIALNNLELVCISAPNRVVGVEDVENSLKKSHMLYDKTGEEHYNIISAMHKSIRGSDANAALYWTTRMLVSGEDPRFIARRLVRAASEDIGNADPHALPLAISTMQGCQLLGMPEADVLLAQCAIYLARAPKSREADSALAKAKRVIADHKGPQPMVPMHIRNAPTKLMKDLGYGRLANNDEEWTFMPPELKDVNFFD